MRRSSLFGHTIEVLDLVRYSRQPADGIVKEFFRARRYLGSSDRRYIAEIAFGILRNYRLLGVYIGEALAKIHARSLPQPLPALSYCSTYVIRLKGESPETVLPDVSGIWRVYVPDVDCAQFLEALKGVELPRQLLENPVQRLAVLHSFPDSIVEEWLKRFGESETEQLLVASNTQAPVTIRVNTLKCTVEECRETLKREGIETRLTLLSPYGLVLERRVNCPSLQSFQKGWFEMQDEGSQLLSILLEPQSGETVIDACAGAGGKTLHIAALMQNQGMLFAIDVEEKRLRNLRERVTRSGATVVRVLHSSEHADEVERLRGTADAVLVDAPCSGVGTMRRNPGAKLTFTEEFVSEIIQTQRAVLERASCFVKPGGRLAYATCSLLKRENEEAVEHFLAAHPEFQLVPVTDILLRHRIAIEHQTPFLFLLPHRTSTDGYFAAVMQRQAS